MQKLANITTKILCNKQYYLLQADDPNTIVKIAKECPCHLWGGTTEIRPIMDREEYEQ